MNRLTEELRIISPRGRMIAIALGIGIPGAVFGYFAALELFTAESVSKDALVMYAAIGTAVVTFFTAYLLVLAYVVSDSERRGMQPFLWLLISVLVPSGIGLILYFILRRPLMQQCARCGSRCASELAFCPSCGTPLAKACRNCKGALQFAWTHCGHCGAAIDVPVDAATHI